MDADSTGLQTSTARTVRPFHQIAQHVQGCCCDFNERVSSDVWLLFPLPLSDLEPLQAACSARRRGKFARFLPRRSFSISISDPLLRKAILLLYPAQSSTWKKLLEKLRNTSSAGGRKLITPSAVFATPRGNFLALRSNKLRCASFSPTPFQAHQFFCCFFLHPLVASTENLRVSAHTSCSPLFIGPQARRLIRLRTSSLPTILYKADPAIPDRPPSAPRQNKYDAKQPATCHSFPGARNG